MGQATPWRCIVTLALMALSLSVSAQNETATTIVEGAVVMRGGQGASKVWNNGNLVHVTYLRSH
jgi:hypothetical protein